MYILSSKMAHIFLVLRFMVVLLLKTKCVFGNTCDCELVMDVLTKEIFDLKIENRQLTSRMDKIEALMDTKTSEMNPSTELDTGRSQLMETRISAIESKIQETTSYSKKSLQLHNLIVKGLRSEKSERLQNVLKIETGLKKINDSLKEFNLQSDAIFQSLKIKTSDHFRDIKSDMSQSIASVRNDVAGISNKMAGLEHQPNDLDKQGIKFIEETMAAIKQDFSRMESDVNAIIDMVILDQKAICQPNCTNDGVCFKDNICKCKPLTEGTRCEIAICDDQCSENGGECVAPGTCKCPEGLFGPNCNNNKKLKRKMIPDNGYDSPRAKDMLHHLDSYTVSCYKDYELYSDRYLERGSLRITNIDGTFSPKVPECVEERCFFKVSDATCFWQGGRDSCKRYNFKVHSRSTVNLKCKDGYKLYKSENGASVEVKGHASIVCRKGSYAKDYKCIPETCVVPSVSHAKLRTNTRSNVKTIEHGKKVTFKCDNGYHFDWSKREIQFETTCSLANWEPNIPKECKPDPCQLTLRVGTSYSVDSNLLTEEDGEKQTFENGTQLLTECKDGYQIQNMRSGKYLRHKIRHSTCLTGTWSRLYACYPAPCSVPSVSHATVSPKRARKYNHEEKITFNCDPGFHFDIQHITMTTFETTCKIGSWTDDIPKECYPDGCELKILKGSKYYLDEGPVYKGEITTSGPMKHATRIYLQCSEHFNVFNDRHRIFLDTSNMPVMTCFHGRWLNLHFCKERCVISESFVGKFFKDRESITAGESIAHRESVKVKCENELHESDPSMECDDGKWKNFVDCSDRPTETSPTGCKLSDDQRFMYNNADGLEIQPGSTIQSGATLIVSCIVLDLYEYYSTNYDYNDTDETPEHTITCIGDTLTQTELNCPEVTISTSDSCMELQHGSVKMENGFFIVSCDRGYSLNLIIPEKPQCSCENGKLRSEFGNQEPVCKPVDCVVPNEIDERLSVIDIDGVSLSGGSVVKIGDVVNMTCSKAPKQIYEPSNRKFKCMNGLWMEAEIDKNWSFGNNGQFPTCREAICNPSCKNGGVCFKDDTCRCSESIKGERCEEVTCDEKCLQNGGNCLEPSRCTCPKGRVGTNCDRVGCILPDNAAKYTYRRKVFNPGEMLTTFSCDTGHIASPRNGMTCLNDGSWSEIVMCEKAVHYIISVKTAEGVADGTDANVYITLHGHSGRTRRIYLRGTFESDQLDETRVEAMDIRPISSVVVGHDGSGILPGWNLEYVSIYVENMEEYYVFRSRRGPVWVMGDIDVVLPREDEHRLCINTFDNGNKWKPKWNVIGRAFFELTSRRRIMSLRGCKQECVNLKNSRCQAVQYNTILKRCIGITVRGRRYYDERDGNWDFPVFLRVCEPFIINN